MAQRDDLYRKFGPILLEAMTLVILENINVLRKEQGMPEITEQDLIDALNNHLSELEPYDWTQEKTELFVIPAKAGIQRRPEK